MTAMAAAGTVKDDWVRSAMTDGRMVAELLVRLKEAKLTTAAVLANTAVPRLRWGIRQPRSRSLRCDSVSYRREADSAKNARCSPATPLSWSGGCGGSDGGSDGGSSSPFDNADGYEATSRQSSGSFCSGSRSKVLVTDDPTNSGTKILRRKKTFAELKEEESVLLKERICLRKEIASLRATFQEQSATNENLKRMKLDLNSKHSCTSKGGLNKENSGQSNPRMSSSLEQSPSRSPTHASAENCTASDPCKTDKTTCAQDNVFLLPDLNTMPYEDDFDTATLYGIS